MLHRFDPPLRACAVLLLWAAALQAQAQSDLPAAADPAAAAPPTRYHAAIAYRVEPAPDASPDRNWTQANAKAAATNSMALTMKPMPMAMPMRVPMTHGPAAPASDRPAPPQPGAMPAHDHSHPMERP